MYTKQVLGDVVGAVREIGIRCSGHVGGQPVPPGQSKEEWPLGGWLQRQVDICLGEGHSKPQRPQHSKPSTLFSDIQLQYIQNTLSSNNAMKYGVVGGEVL